MNKITLKLERKPVVYTTKARCRDCYRCLRACPVDAIKMENGQAQVVTEYCITCGTCVTECPQHAKTYITDYGKVLQMLEGNHKLIASIAPSFAGYYTSWEQMRLPSALRSLGFECVTETAVGAWHTAEATTQYIRENPNQHHITTACPAIVNYINIYEPKYASLLVPVLSPMIAHAKLLKLKEPKAKVVFIGPCIAKKDEVLYNANEKWVDAVITFDELGQLFKLKNITLDALEESSFDQKVPGKARLFPLEGGLLKTAGENTDILDYQTLSVSGFHEITEMLHSLKKNDKKKILVEPLFCRYGCINGPVSNKSLNVFLKRNAVLDYMEKIPETPSNESLLSSDTLRTSYYAKPRERKSYTEEQIREVLLAIDKHSPEDELNCTACGYNTCREKAVAVLDGLAEKDMCIPFIRRITEQKFDTLIQHDPNGIVTLNHRLEITHMNAAFKKMFSCSDSIIGKNISYLVDPDPFEKLTTGDETLLRETIHYVNYSVTAHLIAYSIPGQEQYVGVFMDVTDIQTNQEKLSDIKTETLNKAQELLDHQISMAQELARFLGEHTAKEEFLLNKLIDLTKK